MKNKRNAPTYASTNALRKTFTGDSAAKKTPGPGDHNSNFNVLKRRALSANFGKSTRRPLSEFEKTPSPADYCNDKLGILNSAPKFSVTKTVGKG